MSVGGAAITLDEARITVASVPDLPGISYQVFSRIADCNVRVDMIVQNVGEEGHADISFTVPHDELPQTLEAVQEATQALDTITISHDENVAKISAVGMGMARQTGVADRMFRALSDAGINIQMITTSEIKISVLVSRDEAFGALRAVHAAFALDQVPPEADANSAKTSKTVGDALDVVTRLQGVGMEDLVIDDISLDQSQARVTINRVPDVPGVAAKVFEEIAASGIFVDMIVQSHGHDGMADLSFTVPKDNLTKSHAVAEKLSGDFACGAVTSSPDVAKLSVSGIGLRSHTGVAIRMFRSFAEAGINIDMVNTSEVRVNVVVDGLKGKRALDCLQKAFADVLR